MGTNFYLIAPDPRQNLVERIARWVSSLDAPHDAAQCAAIADGIRERRWSCDEAIVRPQPGLHIGKSSAGWCFSLRVYPEDDNAEREELALIGVRKIMSLDDWRPLIEEHGVLDEYGDVVTPEAMISCITKRWFDHPPSLATAVAAGGIVGPNNLVRRKIDGRCVGHGDGPWDLIVGEFS